MKMSTMLLLAGAAYFLLKPKAAATTAAGTQAPATLEQCLKTGDAASCAKLGFQAASSAATAVGDAIAAELKGMDGMAHASLEGQMDSLGAYSGLGGSFYGGC